MNLHTYINNLVRQMQTRKGMKIVLIDDEYEKTRSEQIDSNPLFKQILELPQGKRLLVVENDFGNTSNAIVSLDAMGKELQKKLEAAGRTGFSQDIADQPAVILLDYRLNANRYGEKHRTAQEFLQALVDRKVLRWLPPIVILTEHPEDISLTIRNLGVHHFASKPNPDNESEGRNFAIRLLAIAGLSAPPDFIPLARPEMAEEYAQDISDRYLAGRHKSMLDVIRYEIVPAINSQRPVLILGETGTGKELVAKALHDYGLWSNKEMVIENCQAFAMTGNYAQSRLFGCDETPEDKDGKVNRDYEEGLLRRAHLNDLFLDEIADMPISFQTDFLRAVENHTFRSMGVSDEAQSLFRLISATNKPVQEMRQDFLFRIARFIVRLPPLRDRLDDIPLIWNRLLQKREECIQTDRPLLGEADRKTGELELGKKLKDALFSSENKWPGNVRQLAFIQERLIALKSNHCISVPKERRTEKGWIVSPQEFEDANTLFLSLIPPESSGKKPKTS